MPFLESDLTKHPHKRKKRDIHKCTADDEDPLCCLYDYHINFEIIGWDWIVYPLEFNAGHCSGECSVTYMEGIRNKLVQKTSGTSPANTPIITNCCASTKARSLSMLYYNSNDELIYGEFPEMMISECSCL